MKYIAFLSLLIASLAHASLWELGMASKVPAKLSYRDVCEILYYNLKPWNTRTLYHTSPSHERKFTPPVDGNRVFRTVSGLDAYVPIEDFDALENVAQRKGNRHFPYILSEKPFTSEFGAYPWFNSPTSIHLRKRYGSMCQKRFVPSQKALSKALVHEIQVPIEEGAYVITNPTINPVCPPLMLHNLLVDSENSFDALPYRLKLVIRSLHPDNIGEDFGIFLRETDPYSLECDTEECLASFKVEPLAKK